MIMTNYGQWSIWKLAFWGNSYVVVQEMCGGSVCMRDTVREARGGTRGQLHYTYIWLAYLAVLHQSRLMHYCLLSSF